MQKKLFHVLSASMACSLVLLAMPTGSMAGEGHRASTSQLTSDGLQHLDDSVMAQVWVKPGVDLGEYTHIVVSPVAVAFKEVTRHSQDVFPIDERQKQTVLKIVPEVLTTELRKLTSYELASEPGKHVLAMQGAVLDIVSHIPPERSGRGGTFVRNLGEATLVIELRDSMTDEVVARAIERRAVSPAFLRRSSVVTHSGEVRSAALRWASDLRRQLDEFSRL